MTDDAADRWSYRRAGVDIDAGDELIRRIGPACKATHRPELLTGLGGFAALSALPAGYREPILVSGTDGVGTKLRLAIEHDRHDHIGQDLVAMCVNDVLVTGAEPFLFLDYYATGALDVDTAERVITGIARACEICGCSLAGGETAEMPGHYPAGDYDLAGFCVGIVERQRIIDGSRISVGDQLIALPSSGAHSNGYSLIRRLLALDPPGVSSEPRPSIDALLAPTRLYVAAVKALGLAAGRGTDADPTAASARAEPSPIHGMAHVTGGGITENLPRMLRDDRLALEIDWAAWELPALFRWLQQTGQLSTRELLRTFNCGIGMVLCVPAADTAAILERLHNAGEDAFLLGAVVPRRDSAISYRNLPA